MEDDGDSPIDLAPLLAQVEQFRAQQVQEKQEIESQVQQLQESIEQVQATVSEQVVSQDAKRHEIEAMEQQLRMQMTAASELWGKVHGYEELLQPMQEGIHDMRQKAEAIASVMTQFQEAGNYQLQAIAEMQVTIERLTGQVPEMVA
jgi:chromosome segregation ATPase